MKTTTARAATQSPPPKSSGLRVLVLVTAGYFPPFMRELAELSRLGASPRPWPLDLPFHTSYLDQEYLGRVPMWRRWFYRWLPVWVAQVCEAFLVCRCYDVLFSWGSEKIALPLALLLRVTRRRIPFVALFGWISPRRQALLLRLTHPVFAKIVLPPTLQRAFAVEQLRIPGDKLVDLPYCVDTDFWSGPESDGELICAAGREMRDYETLIAALDGTGIRCHIAGAVVAGKIDDWRRTVGANGESLALPPNVTVGPKAPAELRELYARSRFVVLPLHPTDTDNGITVMLEAWSMSRAVVCSNVEGQRDAFVDGTMGRFVPARDIAALRAAIVDLWDSPLEARRMGREGRRYAESERRLSVIAGGISEILREAAAA